MTARDVMELDKVEEALSKEAAGVECLLDETPPAQRVGDVYRLRQRLFIALDEAVENVRRAQRLERTLENIAGF